MYLKIEIKIDYWVKFHVEWQTIFFTILNENNLFK